MKFCREKNKNVKNQRIHFQRLVALGLFFMFSLQPKNRVRNEKVALKNPFFELFLGRFRWDEMLFLIFG